MTKEEKELQRLKAAVDAAIEYNLIYTAPEIVYDGFAPLVEHFMRQQNLAAEYFEAGNLPALKRLFKQLTTKLAYIADLQFVKLLKRKAALNSIHLQGWKKKLITSYEVAPPKENKPTWSKVLKQEYIGNLEKTSYVFGTVPEPLIYEDERIKSPDGERVLSITQHSSDGKTGVTMIHVILTRTSLPIYQLNELNSNIQAYWEDNSTVVIQTSGNLKAVVQYNTVQSFDDVIRIEYK